MRAIHQYSLTRTALALSFAGREADTGIDNNPEGQPDWTFSKSAGNYTSGTFLVLVKTAD